MPLSNRQESFPRTIFRVTSGNFLEMFDFSVYGFYAASIAHSLFPPGNEFVSLMLSLATFGVGFLMRPLGAIVLGSYIDRKGRRAGLLLTLALMSAGILMIALTPGYQQIGIAAPIIVVIAPLAAGLFRQAPSLVAYRSILLKSPPVHRRGFFVSWQSGSQQLAVIFAAFLGILLRSYLSPDQMNDWGWRVPFMIGCLIIPVLFVIRCNLQETPEFAARGHTPNFREIMSTLVANRSKVGGAIMLVTLSAVMFNLITAYTPTYGTSELKLPAISSFIVTMVVGLTNFIMLPLIGSLSDRIGRRPVLAFCSGLVILTAYPAMLWLVQAPSFSRLRSNSGMH